MKRYSPAYQWEDSDGPVTVENIARLHARLVQEDPDFTSPYRPLLILDHRQYVELRAGLKSVLEYLTWPDGCMRLKQVYGFHVITTDEEGSDANHEWYCGV